MLGAVLGGEEGADPGNIGTSKHTKSWMNLSYLNNNIGKCTIYI